MYYFTKQSWLLNSPYITVPDDRHWNILFGVSRQIYNP